MKYWIALLIAFIVALFLVKSCRAEIDLSIIATIESSNNPMAYNHTSGATGKYQITQICLKDFRQMTGSKYGMHDMFDEEKCREVSSWYFNIQIPRLLKNYGLEDTTRNRLFAYNAGAKKVKKGIMTKWTKKYIKRYMELKGKR